MFRLLATAAALISVPLIVALPASSQDSFCGSRDVMVQKLSQEFKENPMAVGMVDQSAVLEIFVSDEGTWTILATGTDGTSCVLSAGEGWQSQSLVIGAGA
ncbi:MAG: hypothetical protein KF723_17420 [Rhizobiaceae bacterium]|nr:hypothetical protein [Rhizobiaceae bacterium]